MADPSEQVKTPPPQAELTGTVAGRFRVEARLGAGGMGEVYRAFDTKLQRTVAIKRMSWREGVTPTDRALFLREGQKASALNQGNIAAIYDVLEDRGDVLLVMEFVEGSTLRDVVGPPMPLERFFPIAAQCVDALIAAHDRGILHGDVKPENIMLGLQDQVKLLDFGVARRLPGADPFSATVTMNTNSAPGAMAGTPAYMAPEALKGDTPDARADIFALGLVFYEMLAGRHPFQGRNITVTTAQILNEREAPEIDKARPKLPRNLAAVIARMLAKDPARRYANGRDLRHDLEAVRQGRRPAHGMARPVHWGGLAAGVIVALAVILLTNPAGRSLITRWWKSRPAPVAQAAPRLAVLPPTIEGTSPELSAFADGLSAAVAAKLSTLTQNHDIQVIDSSQVTKAQAAAPDQALRELGANMTLQFVVQQSQEMNRVTYTLASAKNGQHLAADTLTAPINDPFTLQDRVADGVIQALKITLRPDEQAALSVHGTTQPAAYDYYLEGKGYLEQVSRAENITNAITVLNRAIDLDPSFGRALAERGQAEWFQYTAMHDKEWAARAIADCTLAVNDGNSGADGHLCMGLVDAGTGKYEDAVNDYQKAIELEPTNEKGYVGLASADSKLNRLNDAENAYRQAIAANPNSSFVYQQLGIFYLQQANYARAAELFRQAIQLAPESYRDYANLGAAYVYLGDYTAASQALEQSLKLRPTAAGYSNLGTVYYQARRFQDAARNYQAALKLTPQDPDLWGDLASAQHFSGQQSGARDAYEKQLALINAQLQINPNDAERQGDAASVYAALGDKQNALSHLARSLELGHGDKDLLFNAAVVYNDLGETGEALEWLQKSFTAGYSASIVRDSPEFDELRNNPQFRKLLSQAQVK
jgi:eukaryotic-like serine/threonine-protein kinase